MSTTGADIPGLIAAAKALADNTNCLRERFENLRNGLAEHEGCFGDDESSKQLAENYVPNCHDFMSQVGDAISQLGQSASDVAALPGQFQSVDTQNAENIKVR